MGITDFFSDLLSSVSFVQDVHAEAPADDDESKEGGDDEANDEDGGDDKEEGGDEEGGDEEEGGDDDEEEEEEEEEEEPVDPKPQLEEDCAKSAQCSGYKHHYDECVERVTSAEENPDHKGPKEDCVEEYFHLQHCATQCAAVKLFKQLK
ncbi:hypothetical protein PV05_03217 [Exophiala xenobiotica]|uniref:Cytochrome b-c1 complex subunit 6, mitochondrial n=1 Tax=Exophiala xenobiotica TaxID=348802 RepID=A0A0D2ESL3_9EURO|nr:uncharacterized protein PV05_03217 [Exophiala xenobiotica]KIW58718.1 hypothetical protein PV05_03217 [Exophiala xenobiotica]